MSCFALFRLLILSTALFTTGLFGTGLFGFGVELGIVKFAAGAEEIDLDVLPNSKTVDDSRLQPLKDLNGYFPFRPSDTIQQWRERRQRLQQAVRVALGLWPMPEPTPLNAVVHGRQAFDGYTIENVYFESFPGFYVTGNLYRPTGGDANVKRPAVLSPHGHYSNGRFTDAGVQQVRRSIVIGAERFEKGGRNPIQARCVQLARMGCVVLNYDMIGYCDSTQISFQVAHRFAKQRPEMIDPERWGLFSPQAESMLQSVAGLQTYNSIRALDWLSSLPDVDPERIAVTGSSGGGTQTFLLAAVDPRPAVIVPAVMVSTAMQGGCTCENASLLRIGRGNVDFAALAAPRPLCLLSADDWTREMATKGFPELRQHYELLAAADKLEHHPLTHFGHNYNYVSRAVMYDFVNRHLQLGLAEPIVEEDYDRQTAATLSVWNEDHPRPEGGAKFERQLLQHWTADTKKQLAHTAPSDAQSLSGYQQLVRVGWDVVLGRRLPNGDQRKFIQTGEQACDGFRLFQGILQNRPARYDPGRPRPTEQFPVVLLKPTDWDQDQVAIWVDPKGKSGILAGSQSDQLRPSLRRLIEANVAVIAPDLSQQGEHRQSDEPLRQTRTVDNPREAAAYTHGYNYSLFARRVHDILTVIGFAKTHERSPSEIWLIGLGKAGPLAAAARAQAGDWVDQAAIQIGDFRFLKVRDVRDPDFLPGGAKYDDVVGLLSVSAPQPLWLAGSGLEPVRGAYEAAGRAQSLKGPHPLASETAEAVAHRAVDWLLQGL